MTRWIEAKPEDIKVGELVKIIETCKDGSTIIYEGKPLAKTALAVNFSGGAAWLHGSSTGGYTVQLFRAAPDLPKTVGSIVLIPGVGAAAYTVHGWVWTHNGDLANLNDWGRHATAEILYTA